jgi:hypothetical protein
MEEWMKEYIYATLGLYLPAHGHCVIISIVEWSEDFDIIDLLDETFKRG